MNTSQSHWYILPQVTAQMKKTLDSMPDLVTPEEGMSPVPDHYDEAGYEAQGTTSANVSANKDSFQDKDRQKTLAQALQKELHKAP